MIAGTEVTWTRPSCTGSDHVDHVEHTRVVSIETIIRSNGTPLLCATLACNRFVPVTELLPRKSDQKPTPQTKPLVSAQGVITRPQTKVSNGVRYSPGGSREVQSAATRNVQPETSSPATCHTLAFDFMNLIVRAWHAGKPTETHAIRSMFQTVAAAVRALRPSCIVFALDGGHAHRSKLLPSYKAHRPPHHPDLIFQIRLAEEAIRTAGINAVRVTNWEADDVLASIVERSANVVICSSDKDLLALHGRCRIYHPWGSGAFVDPDAKLGVPAGQVTDYLAMCGDTSDGVPGIKGIGPKTAVELLITFGSLEGIIVAARTGRINNSIGKKIAAQVSAALLCQDVIQLRASLPIPELPPWRPPAGYQVALQELGLGSVAAILESIHNVAITLRRDEPPSIDSTENNNNPLRETLSAATLQAEQVENDDPGSQVYPESAAVIDHHRQEVTPPSQQQEPPKPNSTEDSPTRNRVGQAIPVVGADNLASTGESRWEHHHPASLRVASATCSIKYFTAGFSELRESPPPPGTTLLPKFFGFWRDGSKWLIDPNTNRHTCFSDNPITEWRIDSRGPIDFKTNVVRKPQC